MSDTAWYYHFAPTSEYISMKISSLKVIQTWSRIEWPVLFCRDLTFHEVILVMSSPVLFRLHHHGSGVWEFLCLLWCKAMLQRPHGFCGNCHWHFSWNLISMPSTGPCTGCNWHVEGMVWFTLFHGLLPVICGSEFIVVLFWSIWNSHYCKAVFCSCGS